MIYRLYKMSDYERKWNGCEVPPNTHKFHVSAHRLSDGWFKDNCIGDVYIEFNSIEFTDKDDAALFKLTWF